MVILVFQKLTFAYSETYRRKLTVECNRQLFYLSSQNKYSDLEGPPIIKVYFPSIQLITRRPASEQVGIDLSSFCAVASNDPESCFLHWTIMPFLRKPWWILYSIWQMSCQQSHSSLCHPILCKSRLAVQHCTSKSHPSNCVQTLESRS